MSTINGVRLRISEIFYSLQGEADTVGIPTVFVRLTGCPLRCGYCDTEYAFSGGAWQSLEEIAATVATYQTSYVTVTGGEPLAQKACLALLTQLSEQGYRVSLETSGALDLSQVDPRVVKVMDLKTPGSGEQARNHWENLAYLQPKDQIKFVLCDWQDYDWAKEMLYKHRLPKRCQVLFSPVAKQMSAVALAERILADRLPVRFQIQLHKLLWGDIAGK